jgi:hypothetical protein
VPDALPSLFRGVDTQVKPSVPFQTPALHNLHYLIFGVIFFCRATQKAAILTLPNPQDPPTDHQLWSHCGYCAYDLERSQNSDWKRKSNRRCAQARVLLINLVSLFEQLSKREK